MRKVDFSLGGFHLQVTALFLLRKLTISIARAGRGRHSEVLEVPDQVQMPQGCCHWLSAGPELTARLKPTSERHKGRCLKKAAPQPLPLYTGHEATPHVHGAKLEHCT